MAPPQTHYQLSEHPKTRRFQRLTAVHGDLTGVLVLRPVSWWPNRVKEEDAVLHRTQYAEGYAIQALGEENETKCNACRLGQGSFTSCISVKSEAGLNLPNLFIAAVTATSRIGSILALSPMVCNGTDTGWNLTLEESPAMVKAKLKRKKDTYDPATKKLVVLKKRKKVVNLVEDEDEGEDGDKNGDEDDNGDDNDDEKNPPETPTKSCVIQ
ncbi:hypothetical protein H2198_008640 [Neophaeococcomyces mojaviensis]|uniref:Uncharacterized protein n=1 Tax=Neophaeococcomyces mojaviensis TaxID=3383035 RepID=A0ACC2ZWT4_9EURO|nr:hypothetical protein H2198_008640 [Knufia sp. JES_112]